MQEPNPIETLRAFEDEAASGIEAFFTGRSGSSVSAPVCPGLTFARLYMPRQEHTDRVLWVDGGTADGLVADAVVTGRPGLMLGVRVADCVPILVADPVRRVVAAVHAGWRSTAARILPKTIDAMRREAGTDAGDVLLSIGPSIRGCCYNVGEEVVGAIADACSGQGSGSWLSRRGGTAYVNLAEANRVQAALAGVPEDRISVASFCTACRNDLFHSYRLEGQSAGRQGGYIMIQHKGE